MPDKRVDIEHMRELTARLKTFIINDTATVLFPVRPNYTVTALTAILASFLKSGSSTHSGAAGTLGLIIRYCEHHKIRYELKAWPGKGYHIRVLDPEAP